jgi:hypothetical protein
MSVQLVGINPTQIQLSTDVPAFKLGTLASYDDPIDGYREFLYGTSTATITANQVCVEGVLNANFSAITTANTAAGQLGGHGSRVGVAMAAMTAGQSGWFQVLGKTSALTAGAVVIGTRLNTTATAGAVDDDGTASSRALNGIVFKTAPAGAAVSPDVRLFYPTVGVTL